MAVKLTGCLLQPEHPEAAELHYKRTRTWTLLQEALVTALVCTLKCTT